MDVHVKFGDSSLNVFYEIYNSEAVVGGIFDQFLPLDEAIASRALLW